MARPRTVDYVRCIGCGFRKENTHDAGPAIRPGDYCPRCGKQLTEYEHLRRHTGRYVGLFG